MEDQLLIHVSLLKEKVTEWLTLLKGGDEGQCVNEVADDM